MNRTLRLAALVTLFVMVMIRTSFADGVPGQVEWSDGRKETGTISLTPGKDLRLFTATEQVALQLAQVKDIRFTPEKEEMAQGFYFPNAGQATQAKTGDIYPVRYLNTEITLADGQVVTGHLFTTVFYIENDDATAEKIVVMAKQTGTNGEKLADLVYPTAIHFETSASAQASAIIDLTHARFVPTQVPIVVARPDLALLPLDVTAGKPIWTVPSNSPSALLFSVEAADGIHVAWPAPDVNADPAVQAAVAAAIKNIRDFYDTRTLLGCFAAGDGTDVYSLVMMKRMAATYSFAADKKPWSLVVLRWKYDPDTKKTTLLNRVALANGRADHTSPLPAVFPQPDLLQEVSAGK
jgi:hypothetical protein